MGNNAYFPFFPNDWRGDERLAECSYAARGLWLEMMLLMRPSGGYLAVAGRRYGLADVDAIARHTRGNPRDVKRLLDELHGLEVFSLADDGTIYSRKMVRDAERSVRNTANGSKGGNPSLQPGPDNPASVNRPDNRESPTAAVNPPDNPGSDKANARAPIQSILTQAKPDTVAALPSRAQESEIDRSEKSEALDLGEWWCREAAACSAINPAKAEMDRVMFTPGPLKFALEHVGTLRQLLTVHDRGEIERRARNLFARKTAVGPARVLVAALPSTLMDKWDWFDTAEAPSRQQQPAAEKRDLSGGSDYVAAIKARGVRIG